jgi:trans-2,3-dihydro-3-hydroxyanthranilate isomerase
MRRRYFTLDVFTTKRLAGNPLAVVLEPDGLDTATMQAVAHEFNLPETVFVFTPEEKAHRARLRIFTPGRELQFAGHPTVGTAVLLGTLDGRSGVRQMILAEGVGPVTCTVEPKGEGGRARFKLPREPERIEPVADALNIAEALGLSLDDLGFGNFAPENWTAGNPFTFVPVHGLEPIGRARPDMAKWPEVFGTEAPVGAFLFCPEVVEKGSSFHARMFAPGAGIPEDPATGSAAAAFAGLLAASGEFGDGEHTVTIEQGYEMGRPSQIRLLLTMGKGRLTAASIEGDAVLVSEGAIEA